MRGAAAALVVCAGQAIAADEAIDPIEFQEIPGNREFTGELIVKPIPAADLMDQGKTRQQAAAHERAVEQSLAGYNIVGQIDFVDAPAPVIEVPEGMTEGEVATQLMATGDFEYVEPNWRVFALDCPNDPGFDQQYHHDANHMQSCAGWDIFTGDPSVSVGICDTGVDVGHNDLDGNHVDGYNASSELFESEGGDISPTGSHGTQVAGCAAAEGDDGFGVTGVGQNLSYRPVRVSENGFTAEFDHLIGGALTAIEAGSRVSNVSFSGVDSQAVLDAGTSAKQMGGLLVWAAGNDSRFLTFGDRDDDDVIVVGATAQGDSLADFSASGPFVDVVAPGVGVYTSSPGNGFDAVDGTSFASPLTAGLAGLIFSADPSLTPDEVELILKDGVDDLGASGADNTFGHGRINVLGSLQEVTPALEIDLVGEAPSQIDPSGGTSFEVTAEDGTDQLDPGSGTLFFDDGSGMQSEPLSDLGGGTFEAVFPATDCPAEVSFYVSFETQSGEEVTFPRGAPDSTLDAMAFSDSTVVIEDNFETDQGWMVVNDEFTNGFTGQWERGVPGGYNRGDPSDDFDGSGQAYVTGNSTDEDVDDGSTTLISPAFDLSGAEHATVSYARWYSNNFGASPLQDEWIVQITDDNGANWVDLERTTNGVGGWTEKSFTVGDFVGLTSQVQVRFIAQDDTQNGSVVEAAVDAFEVATISCAEACPADLTGPDGEPDGELTSSDFLAYIDLFAAGDSEADFTGDGAVNSEDFLAYIDAFAAGCP